MKTTMCKWVFVIVLMLVLILLPFVLWGEQLEGWIKDFIEAAQEQPIKTSLCVVAVLASDILLPIPSSFVNTAAGMMLGILLGTATAWLGLMISCVLGYLLGILGRDVMPKRFLNEDDLAKLGHLYQRWGDWLVIITRPVPVLAEGAIVFAGMGCMSFSRFVLFTSLSNLGIAAVYAAVGATALNYSSFLAVFAGAILLPACAMLMMRRVTHE